MPPIWWNRNGSLGPGGGLAGSSWSKDFIADQDYSGVSSDLALSSNWGFDVTEGLGVAVAAGGTVGHVVAYGSANDIRVTSEWKFISQAGNGSFGVIGRMRSYTSPGDGYYWVRIYDGDTLRLTTTNGGTANVDSQVLAAALVEGEIFQLIHEITDSTGAQNHLGTFRGQGRTDNGAGAATYNLDGIAAGADVDINVSVDGGSDQNIVFSAGDFANFAAATPDEVAAVIDTNLSGGRAWAIGNVVYVATETFGSTGSIEVSAGTTTDANGVLGLTTGSQAGDEQTVSGSDTSYGNEGFIGFRGGFSANTAQWIRNITVEYLS